MAQKEATVYVVDVGRSMGRKAPQRDDTDLDWALQYVWDKIAATVSTGRKGAHAAVVAFRTDGTDNDSMPAEEAYEHISVLHPLSQVLMPDVRTISNKLKPSNTDEGDIMSAIVTALTMVANHCKQLKYTKEIIVVTNGNSALDADDLDDIVEKLCGDEIKLTILGVDFDDADFGYKEENKDERKAQNEGALRNLTERCGGLFGTLADAISQLEIPRIKTVKPMHSYRGFLSLGDMEKYDSAICIDIERYPRTTPMTPPSASTFVVKSESTVDEARDINMGEDQPSTTNGDGLTSVNNARAYQIKDEDGPGGTRDIRKEDLSKGYEYGATIVPVSESDQLVLEMETKAAYEIVGFIPVESHPHYMNMTKTFYIVPQRTNDKAIMAFSSLVHALYELESHAVARVVLKEGKSPILVLLSFEISRNYECLYENELPFHEDVRSYKFPPLDRIVTISGKTLTVHRNLPGDDLQKAMDDVVDSMDLSEFDRDEEGNPMEYLSMDDIYSPIYHRLNQAIRYRAIHPNSAVPPPYGAILKPMRLPNELLERAIPQLERLKTAAEVKNVPPKTGFRRRKQYEQPRSGLDVSALLSHRASSNDHRIDPSNAIAEFRQMIRAAENEEGLVSPVKQLGDIINDWVRHSFGDSKYDLAVEGVGAMRGECVELEMPQYFNSFMRAFKKSLLDGDLGGDRKEMWWRLRKARLSLIDKKASGVSDVDEDEAKVFLQSR